METVVLARNAMNTRFELVLHGNNAVSLRAAAEAALNEIERIENLLSLFKPASEIARVNATAGHAAVRVSPEVFALLVHARQLALETGGAFDVTMAPLLRCWGLLGSKEGRLPKARELAAAQTTCGMSLVELMPANRTVRFKRDGVMLDLGAIGKGYGVEKAAEILREAGVESALIHGGTSTVCAIGSPPDSEAWKVAIAPPTVAATQQDAAPSHPEVSKSPPGRSFDILLLNQSLSVSSVSGKSFVANGRTFGHVIDPRTGEPAASALLAAVALDSATETDALSTALLVNGLSGHDAIASLRPGIRSLVVGETEPGILQAVSHGIEPSPDVACQIID
jgi:thiamine biosynthesis lipoprotein